MLYSKTVYCFKMAYYCCFSSRGNLDFPEFLHYYYGFPSTKYRPHSHQVDPSGSTSSSEICRIFADADNLECVVFAGVTEAIIKCLGWRDSFFLTESAARETSGTFFPFSVMKKIFFENCVNRYITVWRENSGNFDVSDARQNRVATGGAFYKMGQLWHLFH